MFENGRFCENGVATPGMGAAREQMRGQEEANGRQAAKGFACTLSAAALGGSLELGGRGCGVKLAMQPL